MKTEDIFIKYILHKNNNDIAFFVYRNNGKFKVKYIVNGEMKDIKLRREDYFIESYGYYVYAYDYFEYGIPSVDEGTDEYFECELLLANKKYSFDIVNERPEYNQFYDLLNYLIAYANLDESYKVKPKIGEDDIEYQAIALDNEIISFMKKYETGRDYSFEKKLNEEWNKTDYSKRCNELCSKMNNNQLMHTIFETEYVYDIGDCLERFRPLDIDAMLEMPDVSIMDVFNLLHSNIKFIEESQLSSYFRERIIKNTEVYEQLNFILKIMSNEDLMKLANSTNDWYLKLDYYSFMSDDK